MIKITTKDNIYEIIYKISKSKEEKIILEIPFGHSILHNKVALKSIQKKVGNKKLVITTSDIACKKILKSLGIKHSLIKDKDFINNISNNTKILKHNYTFFEYFKYELKRYASKILNPFGKNIKTSKINKYQKYYKQKTNIFGFLLLLTITIFIFLYIFYFTINKTYVYITPAINVITKSKNFTFKENLKNHTKEEKLIKIEKEIYIEETFKTTGIKQDEKQKSSGEVEFTNMLDTEIKLLPKTRLLSGSGILYETVEWTTIPASQTNGSGEKIPGIKVAKIKSKFKDINGDFSGSRSNLTSTGTILKLPGLDTEIQTQLYAKNISPILGATDNHTKIVGENDKENAINSLKEKLSKTIIEEIRKEIKNQNEANNVTYKILGIKDIYKMYDEKIEFDKEIKKGEALDEFKIKGSIKAYSYAYNTESIISKLKIEIEKSIIPEKENILRINNDSIRISNVLLREEKPFSLKATVEIEVFLSCNFENELDSYTKRLKQTISGLEKQKAEKLLINEKNISNVNIEIRPAFTKKVSKFIESIKFIIE